MSTEAQSSPPDLALTVELDEAPTTLADAVVTDSWQQLVTVDEGTRPRFATRFRVARFRDALVIDFVAEAGELRTRHRRHNDPLYEDDVLEVFLQPPAVGKNAHPIEATERYLELEVSPAGVLFDAWVFNRTDLRAAHAERDLELSYNEPGPNRPQVTVLLDAQPPAFSWESFASGVSVAEWRARIIVPFSGFFGGAFSADAESTEGAQKRRSGSAWRANFFRVQRLSGAEREYSAWRPTGKIDFHRPDRFGALRIPPGPTIGGE